MTELIVRRRSDNWLDLDEHHELRYEIEVEEGQYIVDFKVINDLKSDNIYDFYIKNGEKMLRLKENKAKIINFIDKNNYFPYKTADNYFAVRVGRGVNVEKHLESTEKWLDLAKNAKRTKIGILGSCYSRGAFNSSNYFNPNWKKHFDVAFTQWHSAIPSVVSMWKPFHKEYFTHCNLKEIEFLKDDFMKTFFRKLDDSNVEYLVVDLYSDAVRNLILYEGMGRPTIITDVPNLRKSLYLEDILKGSKIVTQDNVEEFMQIWEYALQEFKEKLFKYIKPEQLVFHKIRMTDRYYTETREVKEFHLAGQKEYIARTNAVLSYMEERFIQELKPAHIIDLTDSGYIGDTNHPSGRSPNHYEPAFYKRFLEELNKIIDKA